MSTAAALVDLILPCTAHTIRQLTDIRHNSEGGMRADYQTQLTRWNEGGLLDNSQILDNPRGGMRADYETQLTGWNEGGLLDNSQILDNSRGGMRADY